MPRVDRRRGSWLDGWSTTLRTRAPNDHARVMLDNLRLRQPAYVLPDSWDQSAKQLARLLCS